MEVLLSVAVSLFVGLIMSRVVKPLKLPAVTGYLIGGLLIGPFALGALGIDGIGFTSFEKVGALKPISDVALGFIAFAIGNEFRLKQLKAIGRQAAVISVFQALSATILVDLGLLILHFIMPDKINVADCITLGAIATATAPAATLMVVNQYKAKGPLVDILLPIVALDDAVGLIVFAVSFGIAKSLVSGVGVSLISVLVNPLIEVIASLLLGALLGGIYTWFERFFHSRSKRLCVAITFVVFAVSLSMLRLKLGGSGVEIGFSPLLVCMMMATVFCNICPSSEELMAKTDRWTAPLFVLFFVISGAELDLSVFSDWVAVLVGVAYIILRSAGKIGGASVSSRFTKCSPTIQKWLGITLLPQAGVALGMSLTVSTQLGPDGAVIRSIVLFSVLIYELVGPMLTKIALTKAGEIAPKETNPPHPEQKRHRAKA
ncbi:MAG: cation:proton antiporter [Oscillospiraceae bacterium]|nr:cation:proton antiporter [Oscillospiraceae bacterium]